MKTLSLVLMMLAATACTQDPDASDASGTVDAGQAIDAANRIDADTTMGCPSIATLNECVADDTCAPGCSGLCDCTCPGPDGYEGCGCPECLAECFNFVACTTAVTDNSWTVQPQSLLFFDLPIGSIRYAVSGYVPESQTCVTVVWRYNSVFPQAPVCDDFAAHDPYVIILPPDSQGNCGQWDYGPNATLQSIAGCVDFADFGSSSSNSVDISLNVASSRFTGTILISNAP